ncbi:hypothetical protein Cgig2_033527 [Carnegiea gigantea]|uniref:Uncharacterized protein n=1 Tax=Carnegiea gigantea TaxID=171969 RepID=A0A9Q1QBH3_9CARY|nr:hypothetical protein Cgig2_033527 [Carnegiea gigantea]
MQTSTYNRPRLRMHYIKSRLKSNRIHVTYTYSIKKKQLETIMWRSTNLLYHYLSNKARQIRFLIRMSIKQRKAMTNIYTIRNHLDQWVEGFEAVSEVMTTFYKNLLGTKGPCKLPVDQNDSRPTWINHRLFLEGIVITSNRKGHLHFKYLGMPITSSKLSKIECRLLIEKSTANVLNWSSRHISYTGRVVLVNTVLFGLFNFWAQIFTLP